MVRIYTMITVEPGAFFTAIGFLVLMEADRRLHPDFDPKCSKFRLTTKENLCLAINGKKVIIMV